MTLISQNLTLYLLPHLLLHPVGWYFIWEEHTARNPLNQSISSFGFDDALLEALAKDTGGRHNLNSSSSVAIANHLRLKASRRRSLRRNCLISTENCGSVGQTQRRDTIANNKGLCELCGQYFYNRVNGQLRDTSPINNSRIMITMVK